MPSPRHPSDETAGRDALSIDGLTLPEVARVAVRAGFPGLGEVPPRPAPGCAMDTHPVFVTIRNKTGQLRGCVGTLVARCPDVVSETWRMAREAAFSDPRFPPVCPSEVEHLRFEVSIVHPLEAVGDPADLDPRRFGIVVSTLDGRRGALLPAIEGVETTRQQLALAREKGGIEATESVQIQRFEVDRVHE